MSQREKRNANRLNLDDLDGFEVVLDGGTQFRTVFLVNQDLAVLQDGVAVLPLTTREWQQ